MLNIGQIEYANCIPLFYALSEKFMNPGYRYVLGVPAVLNGMLLDAEIDVCPSSSIEYACHHQNYRIIPEVCIASAGNVASVLLFSKVPVECLNGKKVLLSSESATSVNLLKILLGIHFGCACNYEVTRNNSFTDDNDAVALLLIGDAALRSSLDKAAPYIYDLGEMWLSWTGYPFVFALWLCRAAIADNKELKDFVRQLVLSKEYAAENLERIAATTDSLPWMGSKRLLAYWRDNISYDLNDHAQAGLMLYYEKCRAIGLIPEVPDLRYVSLND